MCGKCCTLLSIASILFVAQCDAKTVRITANGPVEGIEQMSSLQQKYYAFRSIPYAEAPISGKDPYTGQYVDRRFKVFLMNLYGFALIKTISIDKDEISLKVPEPLKRRWVSNWNATDFRDACLISTVFFPQKAKRSEDCLNLNVYVPGSIGRSKQFSFYY